MEYVTLKNINKTYGSYQASTDVNFSIEKGKLVALLGPRLKLPMPNLLEIVK